MSMTVRELFAGIDCTIIGNAQLKISGLQYRSDQCSENDVFFCIVGMTVDGHSFAQDAIDNGAKVLVVERKVYLADATDVTEVVVRDSRKAMAAAAANFYNHPSAQISLVGITGTNGKTTTSYLVEHIARVAGKTTGVIGTVGVKIAESMERSVRTTPESCDLQQIFARMRDAGCEVVAMEVSSHALDLERTWGTNFAVSAFSNLTQDHLDYHNTFEAYFEAKALLFSRDYPAKRVICIDDKWGEELAQRCVQAGDEVLTVGFNEAAVIHPLEVSYTAHQTTLGLVVGSDTYTFSYPLVGRFNVSNIMLAFGIARSLGIPAETILSALEQAPQIPGRLQRIDGAADQPTVFVDYAHTPDALEKAIASVSALTPGHTIVVFGCGGDRDTSKRPIMGAAALQADYVFVTSDNPRSEDPLAIIDAILAGMGGAEQRYEVVPDRRQAIAAAIAKAKEGDSILIAGKGHEDYQIIGNTTHHFSDAEVVFEELQRAKTA